MPKLIRLYIVNVLLGFAIAALFVAMLVWADVMGLRHLILETERGWLAGFMLFFANGIIFAGVQFGIAVMKMAEPPAGPKGGTKAPVVRLEPVRAMATAARAPGPRRG